MDLFLEYKGLVTQHIVTRLGSLELSRAQDSYNYFVRPGIGLLWTKLLMLREIGKTELDSLYSILKLSKFAVKPNGPTELWKNGAFLVSRS